MNQEELVEQRTKFVADARAIINAADKVGRSMTAEENHQVDTFFAEADKIEAVIETSDKRAKLEAVEAKLKEKAERKVRPGYNYTKSTDTPNKRAALNAWLRSGSSEQRLSGAEIENAVRCGIEPSARSIKLRTACGMGVGINDASDNAVTCTEFFSGYYEELKFYGPVLDLISYHDSATCVSMSITVTEDTANEAAILAEGDEVTKALPKITKLDFGAYKYESQEVPISKELLQDSFFDLESFIRQSLAVRFGRTWNKHITNGTGTGQPFGLTTRASASGVVATGTAAAPTLTLDSFYDLADSIDDAYRNRPGAGYMMHRSTLSKVRKIKAADGHYLWQPDSRLGNPGTINGFPVYLNPDMDTSGANKTLVLFGDYKSYLWRRVANVELVRLDEIRARYGEVVFLGFARGFGNLVQPSAVKKLVAPAS